MRYVVNTSTNTAYLDNGLSLVSLEPTVSSGLTFINNTSFTSASTISIPQNTFSSTYSHYKIIFNGTVSQGSHITLRLSQGGIDNTESVYSINNSVGIERTNWDHFQITDSTISGSESRSYFIELLNPYELKYTVINATMVGSTNPTYAQVIGVDFFGIHRSATQLDSCTFTLSAGTVTGSVSVFGYSKQ